MPSSSSTATVLKQATDLINKGNRAEAQTIISPLLQSDPRNAEAWYLTSLLTDDPEKQPVSEHG